MSVKQKLKYVVRERRKTQIRDTVVYTVVFSGQIYSHVPNF